MDSTLKFQLQVKENVEDTKQFLTDLTQWEKEMKRKDAEIAGKEIPVATVRLKVIIIILNK